MCKPSTGKWGLGDMHQVCACIQLERDMCSWPERPAPAGHIGARQILPEKNDLVLRHVCARHDGAT